MVDNLVVLQNKLNDIFKEQFKLPEGIRVHCTYNPREKYYLIDIHAPKVGVELHDSTDKIDNKYIEKLVGTIKCLIKGGAN